MSKRTIVKTFRGRHQLVADELASYFQRNRVAPGHITSFTCLELGGAPVQEVELVVAHYEREQRDESTVIAKVNYVIAANGVGLRSQEFEEWVAKGFDEIGSNFLFQTITHFVNAEGYQTHKSWFAIYH